MNRCPKCKQESLVSIQGAFGGGAQAKKCTLCHGIWVPSEALEHLSTSDVLQDIDEAPEERPEEDKRTGLCPSGHGILRRARIAWEEPYFLERCAHCHGLWFDAGEWSKVASQSLLDDVSHLWTWTYRRQITDEHQAKVLEASRREQFSDSLYDEVTDLAQRLKEHPSRSAILAYLTESSREK